MLHAYFEEAPKIFGAIWGEINWTLPSLRGREEKQRHCCCQNLWGSNEFRIRQSWAVRSNITVLWVAHLFTCFILIHHLHLANYLLLTWASESTCAYSLCKLSRLWFLLSYDYKARAVLALHWHVIIMASMTTMPVFLESLGTWLFSLAVSHVKQITHRVCFVIESNKQDKLASKQWKEGKASQEISGVSGAAPPTLSRHRICVGQPPSCLLPHAHVLYCT